MGMRLMFGISGGSKQAIYLTKLINVMMLRMQPCVERWLNGLMAEKVREIDQF